MMNIMNRFQAFRDSSESEDATTSMMAFLKSSQFSASNVTCLSALYLPIFRCGLTETSHGVSQLYSLSWERRKNPPSLDCGWRHPRRGWSSSHDSETSDASAALPRVSLPKPREPSEMVWTSRFFEISVDREESYPSVGSNQQGWSSFLFLQVLDSSRLTDYKVEHHCPLNTY